MTRRRMGLSEMLLLSPVSRAVSATISSRMRSSSKNRLPGQCRNLGQGTARLCLANTLLNVGCAQCRVATLGLD